MFELKQLRYFVAVAEELSFRRAAERLHITQPPLSQAIKQLEAALHVTLFARNTHGVQITPAGRVLLAEAHQLLGSVQHSISLTRQAQAGEVGTLHIGYSASAIFSSRLTTALAGLLEDRPLLDLKLSEGNALAHLHALKRGALDAALIRADIANAAAADGLRQLPLDDEPLYVLISHRHRLAGQTTLRMHDLEGERLLLQPAKQQTFLRRQVEQLAERGGLTLTRMLETPDIASMVRFASAGIGAAILPRSAAMVAHGVTAIPLRDAEACCALMLVSALDNPAVAALETRLVAACQAESLVGQPAAPTETS